MISTFFINRPIFANVIAVITVILGTVAVFNLPVEQYPQITPPTVQVTANYPGADAIVVANTVAAPIEQQVNGVENMIYMSSTSASDGSYTLTVTFEIGTNVDMSTVLVQNRVQMAMAQLPEEVQRQGVNTQKQSTAIILVVNLTMIPGQEGSIAEVAVLDGQIAQARKQLEAARKEGNATAIIDLQRTVANLNEDRDQRIMLYLSNFATTDVHDELARIKGVGNVNIFGAAEYGMRMWLDPQKLKARNLTTDDVVRAIKAQNVQVAAGQVGAAPAPADQPFVYTVTTLGQLEEVSQFENIIIKTGGANQGEGGQITYLRDVARVELGGQTYTQSSYKDGKPAATLAIYQLPGANAINVAEEVRAVMKRLGAKFPDKGIEYDIPFDTTLFVQESVHEVYKTLIEAGVLVLIVIMVFLQDWRAVLIPATTVPVTIIGAFAAMIAFGFTVNTLTLFGLVLAIGIVVDDAIVIVENAAHHIETGLNPHDATIKAMSEVTGPVLGVTAVLMAVFLPTAFLGGVTGQLYRQFALTIAATAFISAINALTLKPAQCAVYLKPQSHARKNAFYRGFNYVYDKCEHAYKRLVQFMVAHCPAMMFLFMVLIGITMWGFWTLPTGFLPTEDQGYVIAFAQLPDAASLERTEQVAQKVNRICLDTPGVANVITMAGYSVIDQANSTNAATFYVIFKPWEERGKNPEETQDKILENLMKSFYVKIPEAQTYAFPPPAIIGLGASGGFQMQIVDREQIGLNGLEAVTLDIIEQGRGQMDAPETAKQDGKSKGKESAKPEHEVGLTRLNTTFRPRVPQLYADIDRTKVKTLDVPIDSVFNTLQAYLGSTFVNNFTKYNRTYQVRIQAESKFRLEPEDILPLEVRNLQGEMLPLGTVLKLQEKLGPQLLNRYNLYPSSAITGEAAPGFSSGDALARMEQLAEQNRVDYYWTGMAFQEKQVGNPLLVFAFAVLMVYLVLAALYESLTNPAAVILVVPLAILGTVIGVAVRGMDNNIYTQIGVVLIIALASKNAILIVEFARELHEKGMSVSDAAVEASRARFRPILMTSFAFILGVYPLVIAQGAGAASRQALGTAVFSGMIASTFLAVLFVPVFYVVFQGITERRKAKEAAHTPPPETPPAHS